MSLTLIIGCMFSVKTTRILSIADDYRKLGKTGLEVSEISLGTWQVGGKWGNEFNNKNLFYITDFGKRNVSLFYNDYTKLIEL